VLCFKKSRRLNGNPSIRPVEFKQGTLLKSLDRSSAKSAPRSVSHRSSDIETFQNSPPLSRMRKSGFAFLLTGRNFESAYTDFMKRAWCPLWLAVLDLRAGCVPSEGREGAEGQRRADWRGVVAFTRRGLGRQLSALHPRAARRSWPLERSRQPPGEKTLSVYAHRCKEVWEVRTHQKGAGGIIRHVLASPRPLRPLLARPERRGTIDAEQITWAVGDGRWAVRGVRCAVGGVGGARYLS